MLLTLSTLAALVAVTSIPFVLSIVVVVAGESVLS